MEDIQDSVQEAVSPLTHAVCQMSISLFLSFAGIPVPGLFTWSWTPAVSHKKFTLNKELLGLGVTPPK